MRVFLDECVDWRLSRDLVGHEVKTARQMGWTTTEDDPLLASASEQFDAFLTVDRNMIHQQNLSALPIAVIVLQARTNRLADLKPLIPKLLAVLKSPRPGMATVISENS